MKNNLQKNLGFVSLSVASSIGTYIISKQFLSFEYPGLLAGGVFIGGHVSHFSYIIACSKWLNWRKTYLKSVAINTLLYAFLIPLLFFVAERY